MSQVLKNLCGLGHEECVSESQRLYAEWRASPDPDTFPGIPSSSRPTILCTAVRAGTAEDWTFLWERYGRSNKAIEKYDILRALGCSTDAAILEQFLGMTLDESSGKYIQYT
jgi:aminopeptidase N